MPMFYSGSDGYILANGFMVDTREDEFGLDIPKEVAHPLLEKGWSQKFRTYKTTLQKSLESENEQAPKGIDPYYWKEFSKNENKPKKKEQKVKNAENRAKLQYFHCLGRYSYIQKIYKLVCPCEKKVWAEEVMESDAVLRDAPQDGHQTLSANVSGGYLGIANLLSPFYVVSTCPRYRHLFSPFKTFVNRLPKLSRKAEKSPYKVAGTNISKPLVGISNKLQQTHQHFLHQVYFMLLVVHCSASPTTYQLFGRKKIISKSLLLRLINKLQLRRHCFGFKVQGDGLIQACVELTVTENEETKVFKGKLSTMRSESLQDAALDAILYLKEKFNFQVHDINYTYCYRTVDKEYDRVLGENKKMHAKIIEYEQLLGKYQAQ
ncbi:hypothetical protein LguiB_020707 [Lonicera macranthoides]